MLYEFSQLMFIVFCYYFPYILHYLRKDNNKKQENIVYEQPIYIKKYNKKISKQKLNGSYKHPQEIIVENKFMNDCKECLISLGMKKIDADKKVSNMFNKKNYTSIEHFLMDAYKA